MQVNLFRADLFAFWQNYDTILCPACAMPAKAARDIVGELYLPCGATPEEPLVLLGTRSP